MENINLNNFLGIIAVSGSDAKPFLQGQLTNDISLLDNQNNSQFSAYLNTKGRIQAVFWVVKVGEDQYYLITHHQLISKILNKLKMYVLRSKVILEQLETTSLIFGNNPQQITSHPYVKLPNHHYILIVNKNSPSRDRPTIASQLSATTDNIQDFRQYLIDNGIGLIYPETQEQLIPQQINFDKIGGLNFKKGCYLGQEIIARLHYLGKSKRQMYYFETTYHVSVGDKVISPSLNNQEVGIIVDTLNLNSGSKFIGLISAQSDCIDNLYLDQELLQQLELKEISYYG